MNFLNSNVKVLLYEYIREALAEKAIASFFILLRFFYLLEIIVK